MRAGALNKRVQIDAPTEVKGNLGGTTITFAEYARRWANVKYVSGSEKLSAEQEQAIYNTVITIRYDSKTAQIDNSYRVNYRGRILDITAAVNVDERNEDIMLFCVDRTSDN